MSIIEAARNLGKEIQANEDFADYAKAKLALDKDTDIQAKISEFNIARMNLEQQMNEENQDEAKTQELNDNLRKIYSEVMQSKTMVDFNSTKAKLDTILNDVNSIIMQCVEGADPEIVEPEAHNCSGSCESCGGCH